MHRMIPKALLGLAVTVACITLLGRSVDVERTLAMLQGLQPGWMLLALSLYWLAQLVASLRCTYIARQLGGDLEWATALRAQLIGLWFNQILPSSVGGDVVKVAILQGRLGLGLAVRAGILDRLSGLCFLMLVMALTLPLYQRILAPPHWLAMGVLVAAFLLLLVLAVSVSHVVIARVALPRWLATLFQLFKDVWVFRCGRPLWEQLWTSGLVHGAGVTCFTLVSLALGVRPDWLHFLLLVPLVFLAAVVPLSLAGWGVREVGAVWVFGLVAMPREQALAISLCYGLMLVLAALPGLALFLVGWLPTRARK